MAENGTLDPVSTGFDRPPSFQLDIILLFTYILNIIVGIPGNILALVSSSAKLLSSYIPGKSNEQILR